MFHNEIVFFFLLFQIEEREKDFGSYFGWHFVFMFVIPKENIVNNRLINISNEDEFSEMKMQNQ